MSPAEANAVSPAWVAFANQQVAVAASNLLTLLAVDEGQVDPDVYQRLLGEFGRAARDELNLNPPSEEKE